MLGLTAECCLIFFVFLVPASVARGAFLHLFEGGFMNKKNLNLCLLILLFSASSQAASIGIAGAKTSFLLTVQARQAALSAAAQLATETQDDTDGFPLAPAMLTGAGGPTGGGIIPISSAANKRDGTSKLLGYCSFDNGSSTGSQNRIPGTSSLTAPAFSVIAAGEDGIFNTSCANAAAGVVTGDDIVISYSTSQLRSMFSLYVGAPVADTAALAQIQASSIKDGELRLIKSDNSLVRWSSVLASWSPVNNGGGAGGGTTSTFSLDQGGNLISANSSITGAVASSPDDFLKSNPSGLSQNFLAGEGAGKYLYGSSNNNIGIGFEAARGSLSSRYTSVLNIAIGDRALQNINGGYYNIAIGTRTMQNTEGGSLNSSFGSFSMLSNTSGSYNVAVGSYAGQANTTGADNTTIGALAGNANTGSLLSAIGSNSFYQNTFGFGSSGVGAFIYYRTTTGHYNSGVGYRAGYGNQTGSNLLMLGANSNVSSNDLTYATAIGADSIVGTSNTIVMGRMQDAIVIGSSMRDGSGGALQVHGNITPGQDATYDLGGPGRRFNTVYTVNGVMQTSDSRLKKNVITMNAEDSLNIVKSLRPVRYDWIDPLNGTGAKMGFIAQEVQKLLPEVVYMPAGKDGLLAVNYAEIIPALAGAIQAQETKLNAIKLTSKGIKIVGEVEADVVRAKQVVAEKINSGEVTIGRLEQCTTVFQMSPGAVYEVYALSDAGWASMRASLAQSGPTVQKRESSTSSSLDLNIIAGTSSVCASNLAGNAKISWTRVM
jgi:Chaperone of endosialidase